MPCPHRHRRALTPRIVMLTGDARGTAEAVAKTLQIDEVVAEVQPADKANVIERLVSFSSVSVISNALRLRRVRA